MDYKKEIIKLIKKAAQSRAEYQVFNDFLEMSAISVSNSVNPIHRQEREQRYLDIIGTYEKKEQQLFPQMLAMLVEGLQDKIETSGVEDILGVIFHELELHNKYKGQFFTPQCVSDMMSEMTFNDLTELVKKQGYISALEPACGSGVLITSMCKAMKKAGLNYSTQLVITAVDVDLKCVFMTYLQLALYGVPAVVIHGNSITCEEFSRWYTPVYILGGWVWKQRCTITTKFCKDDEMLKCASEPMYAVFRQVQALTEEIKPPPPPVEKIILNTPPIDKVGQLNLFDF